MIPHPLALEAAGIPARTARRWARARRIPPPWAQWLALTLHGDLGTGWPDWTGWKIDAGALYTPEGWRYERGELLALPWRYQQLAAALGRAEVRQLGLPL